jgi:hypothetical protein
MSWLLRDNWPESMVAFLIGAAITWVLLDRRRLAAAPSPDQGAVEEPVEEKQEALVGAAVGHKARPEPPQPGLSDPLPEPSSAPASEPSRPTSAEPGSKPSSPRSSEPEPTVPTSSEPEPSAPRSSAPEPSAPVAEPEPPQPVFSQLMDTAEHTLFDHIQATDEMRPEPSAAVPPGRYGEGSADAVPHQGPPDGFTIKGNTQSMLFHTPDSPYYGRTKPQVWFRTEADAERAGFTKYARRPRKAADPRD